MRQLRVLVIMHTDLVPPDNVSEKEIDRTNAAPDWMTEYDVCSNLTKLGHQVKKLGVYSDLTKIRNAIEEFKPHIVYNLLEEFDGDSLFDSHVVSYLELLKIPYTGCNPRGLMLARDKALSKKILSFHRINSPKFAVFPKSKKNSVPKQLSYPLIVKCLTEEASLGISQASIVQSDQKLLERAEYINQKLEVDAIAEQFVEGREFFVGILGNHRIQTLPTWELHYENVENPEKEFYTRQAKWNAKYRKRKGIRAKRAKIDQELEKRIQGLAKRVYRALNLSGVARIDLRMDPQGKLYVIEANPNPNIALDDELAQSWLHLGQKYPQLIQKILQMGLNWSGKKAS